MKVLQFGKYRRDVYVRGRNGEWRFKEGRFTQDTAFSTRDCKLHWELEAPSRGEGVI